MHKKILVLIIILCSITVFLYSQDSSRAIHMGFPKEQFELQGPVKRVTYISDEWKSSEEDEWTTSRSFSYTYSVRFNTDGYNTFWEKVQIV